MRFLIDFVKVLVLLLGALLIAGGSLASLCGVLIAVPEMFVWGIVAAVVGAALFIPINRRFREAARTKAARQTSGGEEK